MPITASTPEEMALRYAALRKHFESGATHPYAVRRDALKTLGNVLREYEAEVLEAMRLDMRKPTFEAYMSELGLVHAEIRNTLKHLKEWMRPARVPTPLALQVAESFIHRAPLGLVLIIGPWNYPVQLILAPLIGAVAAGNCALVKPSNEAPHTSAVIERILTKVFDPGHVAVVQGPGSVVGPQLIQRFQFDHIFFTGSPAVGKKVAAMAAPNLTPVTLELGGKSPAIVDRHADVDTAARRIAWAKYFNAGQTCISPDHALVHKDVMEVFLVAFAKYVTHFFGDDPQQSPHFGRVINDKRFAVLSSYLNQGSVRMGGTSDAADRYIAPTVLTGVSLDSPLMQEELFGPILPVIPWKEREEVLAIVRRNPFPLSAYIFTTDRSTERFFIEHLAFGGGCVNHCMLHFGNEALPFGGIGNSGQGHYHGRHSFERFSHAKSIVRSSTWINPGVQYPPYSRLKEMVLRWVLG